jgi:hypothetical protein
LAVARKPRRIEASGGHYLAEEAPEATLACLDRFLPRA